MALSFEVFTPTFTPNCFSNPPTEPIQKHIARENFYTPTYSTAPSQPLDFQQILNLAQQRNGFHRRVEFESSQNPLDFMSVRSLSVDFGIPFKKFEPINTSELMKDICSFYSLFLLSLFNDETKERFLLDEERLFYYRLKTSAVSATQIDEYFWPSAEERNYILSCSIDSAEIPYFPGRLNDFFINQVSTNLNNLNKFTRGKNISPSISSLMNSLSSEMGKSLANDHSNYNSLNPISNGIQKISSPSTNNEKNDETRERKISDKNRIGNIENSFLSSSDENEINNEIENDDPSGFNEVGVTVVIGDGTNIELSASRPTTNQISTPLSSSVKSFQSSMNSNYSTSPEVLNVRFQNTLIQIKQTSNHEPTQFQTQNPAQLQTQIPTQLQTQNPTQLQTQIPTQFQTQNPTQLQTQLQAQTQAQTQSRLEREVALSLIQEEADSCDKAKNSSIFAMPFSRAFLLFDPSELLLSGGTCFFTLETIYHMVCRNFRSKLSSMMTTFPTSEFSSLISSLHEEVDKIDKFKPKGSLTLDNLLEKCELSFPPCMYRIFKSVTKSSYATFKGRFELSLFMKALGLDYFSQYQFWKATLFRPDDQWHFESQIVQLLKQIYGLDEAEEDFLPHKCLTIINHDRPIKTTSSSIASSSIATTKIINNMIQGCPFSVLQKAELKVFLKKMRRGVKHADIDEIATNANTRPQEACKCFFNKKFFALPLNIEEIESPPKYFNESEQRLLNL